MSKNVEAKTATEKTLFSASKSKNDHHKKNSLVLEETRIITVKNYLLSVLEENE